MAHGVNNHALHNVCRTHAWRVNDLAWKAIRDNPRFHGMSLYMLRHSAAAGPVAAQMENVKEGAGSTGKRRANMPRVRGKETNYATQAPERASSNTQATIREKAAD